MCFPMTHAKMNTCCAELSEISSASNSATAGPRHVLDSFGHVMHKKNNAR